MVARESGKHRAARIPYNYLGTPDRFVARRVALSALALLVVAALAAWGLVDRDLGRSHVSHGPLTSAHATWETRCDACHGSTSGVARWLSGRSMTIASDDGDRRCQSCHMGTESQAHHAEARADRVPHCAECHREHEGRDASMVRLDDASCTSCHRDLHSAMTPPARTAFADTILHFNAGGHPVFRSTASDPGRLKFNHSLHLTRGLTFGGGSGRPTTFANLGADVRGRYGWKEGVDLGRQVQLDCASCHRLDDPPGDGAYYRPVTYSRDCAACHPLTVPGRDKGTLAARGIGDDASDRGALGRPVAVPHGLQPGELIDRLRTIYLGLLLDENPGLADDASPLGRPDRRQVEETARRQVASQAENAAELLLGPRKSACTECHYYLDPSGRDHAEPDRVVVPRDWTIQPTAVPSRWFRHGRFDHVAHRAVDCRSCHARAFADGPDASGKANGASPTWASHADVLLPTIDDCASCHAPRGRRGGEPTGGARFDCTECHTYHGGDHPGQGRGSAARGLAAGEMKDIRRFLLGTPAGGR